VFPSVPASLALTLSGHTHGAQFVPPLIGPIVSTSAFGQRYRYGRVVEDGHELIVTSGIGGRPLRWNVPPEIVEIRIGIFPKARIGASTKKS
jgi:predicted MPP superfamily phosphohydrolase